MINGYDEGGSDPICFTFTAAFVPDDESGSRTEQFMAMNDQLFNANNEQSDSAMDPKSTSMLQAHLLFICPFAS